MVSGIALVMVLYMVINYLRKQKIDMLCLDTIARYLFYIIIIDFAMESLDQIHRFYEAEESFEIISLLMSGHLNFTLLTMQVGIGMLLPLITLGIIQFYKPEEKLRKVIYLITGILVLIGIFFMRWNVVIGGQLFSKSFLGFTSFKLSLIGPEGFLMASIWLIVPFFILAFLLWLFPPWKKTPAEH
jgi:predicted membrane protein